MKKKKKNIQRALLERFIEKSENLAADGAEASADHRRFRGHARRFVKMVENRRQQILDKLLMD